MYSCRDPPRTTTVTCIGERYLIVVGNATVLAHLDASLRQLGKDPQTFFQCSVLPNRVDQTCSGHTPAKIMLTRAVIAERVRAGSRQNWSGPPDARWKYQMWLSTSFSVAWKGVSLPTGKGCFKHNSSRVFWLNGADISSEVRMLTAALTLLSFNFDATATVIASSLLGLDLHLMHLSNYLF